MGQYDNLAVCLIFGVSTVTISLIDVTLTCQLRKHLHQRSSINGEYKQNCLCQQSMIWALININLLCIGSACFLAFNVIDYYLPNTDNIESILDILSIIHAIINSALATSFCLFCLARLKDSFDNTAYAINKSTIIFCLFFTVCILVATIFNDISAFIYSFIFPIILVGLYFTLIIILFAKRLFILTLTITDSEDAVIVNRGSSIELLEFSAKQSRLLTIISKQTLLLVVILGSSLILLACSFVFDKYGIGWDAAIVVYGNTFAICIWFSFSVAQKQYNYCCSICHRMMLSTVQKIAKLSIRKQTFPESTMELKQYTLITEK